MKCEFCNHEINGKRHKTLCPYNPVNTLKIILFLKEYLLKKSSFNKNFCPFPSSKEFDKFCKKNKIARVKTIVYRYLDDDLKLNDWLTEILDYALNNNIVSPLQFPYFLQFIYDAWCFHPLSEYKKLYEQSIIYEDGDSLLTEISQQSYLSFARIQKLRNEETPFLDRQLSVEHFLS